MGQYKTRLKIYIIRLLVRLINKLGYKECQTICYGETSRIYKQKIAPEGKIFYILKAWNNGDKYVNAILFSSKAMDDLKREIIYTGLLDQIKKKYGI